MFFLKRRLRPARCRAACADAPEVVRRLDKRCEFDHDFLSSDRPLGPGCFAGSFAGEHVAPTEFVIGVLFVNWGAGVWDIFGRLAIGNLLAVLTWTLICASRDGLRRPLVQETERPCAV